MGGGQGGGAVREHPSFLQLANPLGPNKHSRRTAVCPRTGAFMFLNRHLPPASQASGQSSSCPCLLHTALPTEGLLVPARLHPTREATGDRPGWRPRLHSIGQEPPSQQGQRGQMSRASGYHWGDSSIDKADPGEPQRNHQYLPIQPDQQDPGHCLSPVH